MNNNVGIFVPSHMWSIVPTRFVARIRKAPPPNVLLTHIGSIHKLQWQILACLERLSDLTMQAMIFFFITEMK